MLDLRVAFEADEFRNVNAAEFAHAPEIVAQKIGYHHQLGHFLSAGLEFVSELRIARRIRIAWTGAFNGTRLDVRAAQAQKALRRTARELEIYSVQISGERRGRRFQKPFVKTPWRSCERRS